MVNIGCPIFDERRANHLILAVPFPGLLRGSYRATATVPEVHTGRRRPACVAGIATVSRRRGPCPRYVCWVGSVVAWPGTTETAAWAPTRGPPPSACQRQSAPRFPCGGPGFS